MKIIEGILDCLGVSKEDHFWIESAIHMDIPEGTVIDTCDVIIEITETDETIEHFSNVTTGDGIRHYKDVIGHIFKKDNRDEKYTFHLTWCSYEDCCPELEEWVFIE